MMDKKKLMTVGEIAKSLGITRRMIMNYEDRGLITSDLREGEGYRYYTMDTLIRIRSIRLFQNMGLTLDEIREYLDDSSDLAPMLARLEALRDELNLNIEKVRERMQATGGEEVRFATLPSQTVYRWTGRSVATGERMSILRDTALAAIREYGSDITRRLYFIEYAIHDPDEISCCATVPAGSKGEHIIKMPECDCICLYYHGDYGQLPAVREKLIAYAKENGIELDGTCRHIYLEGPPHHKDPSKFITQVAVPIVERRRREPAVWG